MMLSKVNASMGSFAPNGTPVKKLDFNKALNTTDKAVTVTGQAFTLFGQMLDLAAAMESDD